MKKILFFAVFMVISNVVFAAQGDGRKTVTTAGTAVALSSSEQFISQITVCAETDNTGVIAIGESPIAALATREGVPLFAGDCWSSYRNQDLKNIKIDSTVNGDGVTYEWILANQ